MAHSISLRLLDGQVIQGIDLSSQIVQSKIPELASQSWSELDQDFMCWFDDVKLRETLYNQTIESNNSLDISIRLIWCHKLYEMTRREDILEFATNLWISVFKSIQANRVFNELGSRELPPSLDISHDQEAAENYTFDRVAPSARFETLAEFSPWIKGKPLEEIPPSMAENSNVSKKHSPSIHQNYLENLFYRCDLPICTQNVLTRVKSLGDVLDKEEDLSQFFLALFMLESSQEAANFITFIYWVMWKRTAEGPFIDAGIKNFNPLLEAMDYELARLVYRQSNLGVDKYATKLLKALKDLAFLNPMKPKTPLTAGVIEKLEVLLTDGSYQENEKLKKEKAFSLAELQITKVTDYDCNKKMVDFLLDLFKSITEGQIPEKSPLKQILESFSDRELLFLAAFFKAFSVPESYWLNTNFPHSLTWNSFILSKLTERFLSHANTTYFNHFYSKNLIQIAANRNLKELEILAPLDVARMITLVWTTGANELSLNPPHGLPFIYECLREVETWLFSLCETNPSKAKFIYEMLEKIDNKSTTLIRGLLRQNLRIYLTEKNNRTEYNEEHHSVAMAGLLKILRTPFESDNIFIQTLASFFMSTPFVLFKNDISAISEVAKYLINGESILATRLFGSETEESINNARTLLYYSGAIHQAFRRAQKSKAFDE